MTATSRCIAAYSIACCVWCSDADAVPTLPNMPGGLRQVCRHVEQRQLPAAVATRRAMLATDRRRQTQSMLSLQPCGSQTRDKLASVANRWDITRSPSIPAGTPTCC